MGVSVSFLQCLCRISVVEYFLRSCNRNHSRGSDMEILENVTNGESKPLNLYKSYKSRLIFRVIK